MGALWTQLARCSSHIDSRAACDEQQSFGANRRGESVAGPACAAAGTGLAFDLPDESVHRLQPLCLRPPERSAQPGRGNPLQAMRSGKPAYKGIAP